jgi:hypothetical protein
VNRRRSCLRRALLVLPLLSLVAVGCSDDGGDREGDEASSSQIDASWLFALLGDRATATSDADGFTVVLSGSRDVVAFTDRPDRLSRRIAVGALVENWGGFFDGGAPNGVIAGRTPDGDEIDVVVELTDVLLVGVDVLEFRARPIGDDADIELPSEISDVSLFIDDATCPDCLVYSSTFVPFDSSF